MGDAFQTDLISAVRLDRLLTDRAVILHARDGSRSAGNSTGGTLRCYGLMSGWMPSRASALQADQKHPKHNSLTWHFISRGASPSTSGACKHLGEGLELYQAIHAVHGFPWQCRDRLKLGPYLVWRTAVLRSRSGPIRSACSHRPDTGRDGSAMPPDVP